MSDLLHDPVIHALLLVYAISCALSNRDEVELLDNSEWLEPSGNKLQHGDGDTGLTIVNKPGVFERSIVMKNKVVAGEATLEMVPNISEFYYQRERLVQCLSNNTELAITGRNGRLTNVICCCFF